MKPNIPKSTVEALERVDANIIKCSMLEAKRMRPRAMKLLNTFQKKVKTRVRLVHCNGSFWLTDENNDSDRYAGLRSWLDDVSNPLSPGSYDSRNDPNARRNQEAIMRRFPELVELWWIAYTLDATWCRPGLCDLEATVKPFRDGKGLSDEIA